MRIRFFISLISFAIFRSTLQRSRPNIAGLKCPSVRIRTYVLTSVHPQSFFDFNEIWCVGRGRRVMHDGMQYDPIQGQGQGHEPYKVGNLAIFKRYLLCQLQWELATDHGFLNIWPDFWYSAYFLCHVTLKFAVTSLAKSRPSVPYGANLLWNNITDSYM